MSEPKISLFHAGMQFYVPTHNYLWRHFENVSYENVDVINVSNYTFDELICIANKSDALFIDHSLRYAVGAKEQAGTVFYFETYRDPVFYEKVWLALLSLNVKKAYSLLLSDMQSMKNFHHQECMEPHFDFWLNNVDCIFWAYEHSNAMKNSVPPQYLDEYLNYSGTADPFENRSLILDKKIITIDFPHFVDESELLYSPKTKYWDWIISGALYGTRKLAHNSLVQESCKSAPSLDKLKWLVNTLLKKIRIYLNVPFLSLLGMRYNAMIFKFTVSRSRLSFVCGSGYRYMVRKFYEIPAFRVAMIAYPADGMSEYGFVAGKHYLSCDPESVGDAAKTLLSNDVLRKSLCDAAFDLITQKHTTKIRAAQLIDVMRSLAKGALLGAHYESGEFIIRESD